MASDLLARGLAARTFATARASSIAVEELGARATGNARGAVQRAIDLAVANGIPKVTCRLPRMELWEPVLDDPNGTGLAWFLRNRTLRIPACEALDIDFGGSQITLRGPTGGAVFPGQPCTTVSGLGAGWVGGFLTVTGFIKHLRVANLTCDGGYIGNPLTGEAINLLSKGFLCQDLGDASFGTGNGFGDIVMENVTMHSFAGEIMYDNSSRNHLSRDCHFHTSPQSCWNPGGIGRLVAYNVQAGNSSQPAEIVGGKGHTYFGGRFYRAGNFGSAVIGGPDPTFAAGHGYNYPERRTDAPPPYIVFHGTRFEDYLNYLYLGSYVRGSISTTDVAIFIAPGFASSETIRDIDLDVHATVDRQSAFAAVTVGGPAVDNGAQPNAINIRVHCGSTNLATTGNRAFSTALSVSGLIHPTCSFSVDGHGTSAFSASQPYVAGAVLPLIDTSGFVQTGNPDYLYFASDQTYTIASRLVNLYPTAPGTFAIVLNTTPGYTTDQLFTFYHDGSGAADRIVSFARTGAGMRLKATRTLRRAGEYLTLRRSGSGNVWVEHAYFGDEGPQTIPVLATAMVPNATNGPAPGLSESAINKVMMATLDFDAATAEAAQIAIPMPRNWNEGAVSVQFVWTAGSGTNAAVVWGCQALALSDDDALDAAFGAAQLLTDTVTAAGDVMETAYSAPVAIAGSPLPEDLVVFRFYRDAAHLADTLVGDARLIAVRIRYDADAGNDA